MDIKMKHSMGYISFLAFMLFRSSTILAQDHSVIKQCFIPETIEHDRIEYGVLLPPSYKNTGQSYPVIYHLHGLNGHFSDWKSQSVAEFYTELFSNGTLPECILVFPDGEEGFWCNHYDGDPLLDKELVEYLIPHVDSLYLVDTDNRLIMGWSAGGAGALTIFSKYPKLFKASISLDGSIMSWEEFQNFQGNKPDIVNNSDYYYQNASPYEWVVTNTSIITEKQDTAFFIAAAFLAKYHQNFLSILKEQQIPYIYTEVDCNHEFACVFSEIGDDLTSFLKMILE
jgi:enterochelin esterase-like enzyme